MANTVRKKIPEWIEKLADESADSVGGFFGPDTVQWQISREQALFVGGLRALLMQIAHPAIAHATRGHSSFYTDPFGRLQRTFEIVHAMIFGDRDAAVDAATRLWRIHERVNGTLPAGTPGVQTLDYSATDSELLFWVAATLLDSTVAACNYVLPQTDPTMWEPLYAGGREFAFLCGVKQEDMPETLAGFQQKMDAILESDVITVSPDALHIKDALLSATPVVRMLKPYNQMVAAGLLPEKLRVQFELPWGPLSQVGYRANGAVLQRVIPLLPPRVRYVPAYMDAAARCGDASLFSSHLKVTESR